ncbi:MAG: hypothetical protein HYU27_00155 [Acidobacteria bacterium]|nr:hypothetical protein [Acidobacteriota bacterium]
MRGETFTHSDAVVQGNPWDANRRAIDSTGFVTTVLGKIPTPNNYELGDGLNTAGYRWVRRERGGNENLFGFSDAGIFGGIDRKQLNVKADHNFNPSHRVAVTYTYERDDGLANYVKSGIVRFTGGPTGSYFSRDAIKPVPDPRCAAVARNLRSLCTPSAVADAASGQVLLQNPLPGRRGTLGQRVLEGPGRWRFDVSMAKSIRLTESKSLEFRMDAQNVLNHPDPQFAVSGASLLNLDINNTNFGLFTGPNAKTTGHREFQAQLRLNF